MKRNQMKKLLAVLAVSLLLPTAALAQERAGDAALGAISGALVGGPIGAVAGGVIGFTAGPHIARGLGFRHHRSYRHRASARASTSRNTASTGNSTNGNATADGTIEGH
jgi:hypothetical protein